MHHFHREFSKGCAYTKLNLKGETCKRRGGEALHAGDLSREGVHLVIHTFFKVLEGHI